MLGSSCFVLSGDLLRRACSTRRDIKVLPSLGGDDVVLDGLIVVLAFADKNARRSFSLSWMWSKNRVSGSIFRTEIVSTW
jgi:hypothetical protein